MTPDDRFIQMARFDAAHAKRVWDGSAATDDAPAWYGRVATLIRAAAAPATEDELAGEPDIVARMEAAMLEPATGDELAGETEIVARMQATILGLAAKADDDAETSTTHTVTVTEPAPPPGPDLSAAYGLIDQLVANRKISRDFGQFMKGQINQAQNYIRQGRNPQAVAVLRVVVAEIDLLVQFRQMTAADGAPLRNLVTQTITQLGGTAQAAKLSKFFKGHGCRSHQRLTSHLNHHKSRSHHRRW